jgi:hypothetical protein
MTDLVIAHPRQSSWFAGLAWALTVALRKNGAHVRYLIWFAAWAEIPHSVRAAQARWIADPVALGRPE